VRQPFEDAPGREERKVVTFYQFVGAAQRVKQGEALLAATA
jgi:hypothetical protein